MSELAGKAVVVIGRGSGIARSVVLRARAEGARVIVAGRDAAKLAEAYRGEPGISAATVDLTDDASIEAFAGGIGPVDHVVSTASARARGRIEDLSREAVRQSFDTKVIGPLMLARQLVGKINSGGSLVLFSGVNAFKVNVGYLGVAITNGAVDFLTRSLAVELAPIRVNAISPGVIDTGIWDQAYLEKQAAENPARRVGTAEDIASAVMFAMTNTFLTGVTLKVDGGEPLT
jgi:NAD(P)-dependent dehydrogenase (short-subunit alcohol dehydrogenase family)